MKIKINGVNLFYTVSGQAPQSLVLVHGGLGLDHSYLKGFAELLAQHFTVYLLDLRNHGASDRCDLQSCSVQQISDDLLQFCQSLNIERPILLGHSMGANVALELASVAPDMLKGVVCLGAAHYAPHIWVESFRAKGGELAAQAAQQYYAAANEQTFPSFMQHCVPLYNIDALPQAVVAAIDINLDLLLYSARSIYTKLDLATAMTEVVCPVLLLDGDEDPVVQIELSQKLSESYSNCTSAVIAGAGHDAYHSHAQQCLDSILTWMGE